ncbi:MAG: primosomal protein N', partial [Ruthenibacterium sp.]
EKIVLSSAQQAAFDALNALRTAGKPAAALLHGVTSSGKTLVFLRLIQETVKAGRQALVLVPEISLTPQMIDRLKAYFGERVAVQHSALSHTERLLQWQQIQNGAADIVVGTRSAVFAPLQSIGVIIIDEEQEHTYHSESAPRYSAHEVAKQRALAHHALLLLASATPSTESYYAAKEGRYHLVELHERYGGMPLPQVRLVDMRTELAAGNAGAISGELQGEIEQNLRDGKQTILLLNRRGYKTVGMCTKCAEAIRCDACSVPMVYHKADGKLLCHYCGKSISPVPEICPKCGERIKYTGFGTQRVEEELAEKFPKARVLRMDADSTSRKNAHETML